MLQPMAELYPVVSLALSLAALVVGCRPPPAPTAVSPGTSSVVSVGATQSNSSPVFGSDGDADGSATAIQEATRLMNEGKYAEAMTKYEEGLKRSPDDEEA